MLFGELQLLVCHVILFVDNLAINSCLVTKTMTEALKIKNCLDCATYNSWDLQKPVGRIHSLNSETGNG